MNKIFFTICLLVLVGLNLNGTQVAASQSPHWLENNIDCLDCHVNHQGTTTACIDCHDNISGANYSKLSAPAVDSHVGLTCITCHDPHSSGQCTVPLVTGTFSGYQLNAQTTTFTIDSLNVLDPAWSDPASWSEKSGAERGLIFTVVLGLWDTSRTPAEYVDYSAEVVAADGTSITVNGIHAGANLTGSMDFSLIFGQLIRNTINTRPVIFTGPSTFAANDGQGIGGSDSTPDGVCQVCHTQTAYWRNDGSLVNHNNGQDCSSCHDHKYGFAAGCNNCHGNPPMVDIAQTDDGLVVIPSATGSVTAGSHELHASEAGSNYPCSSCHFDGMPVTPITDNNKIQIGFALNTSGSAANYDGQANLTDPYVYEGTNGATVTTGGTLICSNIYCHGDGTPVATNFFDPSIYSPQNVTTPPWNGQWNDSDDSTCNNCHQYPPQYNHDDPKANSHFRHMQIGYTCQQCHYATTQDGVTVDSAAHGNGVYDVVAGLSFSGHGEDHDLSFEYIFDPGGGTCASNTCHSYWGLSKERWGNASITASLNIQQGTLCGDVSLMVNVTGGYPSSPVAPYTCYYEWGDGTITDWSNDCSASHVYDAEGSYDVTWSVRDARMHTLSGTPPVTKTTPVSVSFFSGCLDPATTDTDGDGMIDIWENLYGLNFLDPSDALLDHDGDGLTNLYEFNLNTDPTMSDTDDDGVDDGHDGYPLDNLLSVCSETVVHFDSGVFYSTVGAAYNSGQILSDNTVRLSASDRTEDLLFDQNIIFTLSGGFDCSFINNPVNTEISGSLVIAEGTLTVDRITIK